VRARRWQDAEVGLKRERQASHANRALVAAYHEARLAELREHVAEAVDRFRAGNLDAFAVDDVIRQCQRAARELWKFCWLAGAGAAWNAPRGCCATWLRKTTASTGGSAARQPIANESGRRRIDREGRCGELDFR
jgi:hypothetical protein